MRNRTFADLDRVVALGGGHGLGRVMSPTTAALPDVFAVPKAVLPGEICATALTN